MLVIFDCDGVLVDSERLAAEAFSLALKSVGITMSSDDCLNIFRGHTLETCFTLVEKTHKLPHDFADQLLAIEQQLFAARLRAVPGVIEVIRALVRQKVPCCVASNGKRHKVEHSLALTGLASFFGDNIFSAEQVKSGKPAPDVFLLAAKVMGVETSRCWVVEDSSIGITAGRAAGMSVVAYAPNGMVEAHAGVHVITQMRSLPQCLGLQPESPEV